jgi:hypothetical protein
MLYICVQNMDGVVKLNLTLGKTYESFGDDGYTTNVKNDIGNICSYMKSRFKPLSEFRNEKIDKIIS